MTEYNLLGVKLNVLPEYLLKNKLVDFLNSDEQHQITTINPEFVIASQKNKKFLDIINQASLSLIDGTGIIKGLQYTGHDVSLDDRITGVRLSEILIDLANNKNYKILFCLWSNGLTKKDKFFMKLKNEHPSLDFQVADEKTVFEKAKLFAPEIILVGFGAPLQDIWIYENLKKMSSVKIAAGVGGTFDFMSGKIRRAPKFMRSFGLEWLWRLLLQPNRLFRINRAVLHFSYLIYKQNKKNAKNKN
jgi:N-acetylglucosaminyldiphosphoundecaprenol N-acetyl-beta-D-mannosaminyltransferase